MLYPTINQLTSGQFNRYELVIATAKCARMVTDEYVRQREAAEKAVAGVKDGDKNMSNMIDKEYRDEKAVKVAINHIHSGDFTIAHPVDSEESDTIEAAENVAADAE
jgi:DNA-directed RNA polymerase omega subunit